MSSRIADSAERERVLDAASSFIVRAPAGSGKTELLMQRYLRLLATVEEPEEILAITFTRKAAAEMRQRILAAIWPLPGDKKPLKVTQQLAEEVRKVNKVRGWQLEEYPARLRIRTIDSVNSWLTACAPATGEGTAQGGVSEQTRELYELAARRGLECIAEEQEPGPSLRVLLAHLDNQTWRFIGLMAQMLATRDQWLGLIGAGTLPEGLRATLEDCLCELAERELLSLQLAFPQPLLSELCESTRVAAANTAAMDPDAPLSDWLQSTGVPAAEAANLALWQSFAGLWLTAAGTWRKRLDKNSGFPAAGEGKTRATELIHQLSGEVELADQLTAIRELPPPHYSESQWEALSALIRVLPQVVAQLLVIFRETGKTDYPQVAREALDALHSESGPSALALRLDYRISHILIDEFQDTSVAQHELLRALTAGWSAEGRRTIFIVGDPMQSIYRFRQAEVGLFLRLWNEQRVDQVPLEQVELAANFRSDKNVVDWVNDIFNRLLPEHSDPLTGRVRFSQSIAANKSAIGAGVFLHPRIAPARLDEASDVADIVEETLQQSEAARVGILVRTRSQARYIIAELRRRNIDFQGSGLDQPGESSVEQDLIALARALAHLGDRVAWMAVLRASWCGLTLIDLEALCGDDWKAPIWQLLNATDALARLTPDGRQRAASLRGCFEQILARRARLPFRDWVEGAWQQLGGPAALTSDYDLERVNHVLTAIDRLDTGSNLAEAFHLHELLGDRPDSGKGAESRVDIMTMHKAKGLQFHTVILPGLDSGTRGNEKSIMAWHEIQRNSGEPAYLLAPIEALGEDSDPLQAMVRRFESEQEKAEQDRLLYVATTRAEHRLHLFFGLDPARDGGYRKPRSGSLLARLWPALEAEYADYRGEPGRTVQRDAFVQPPVRRFPADHNFAAPASVSISPAGDAAKDDREITFDWATVIAAQVGSVVHRMLQHLAVSGVDGWEREAGLQRLRLMLAEAGVSAERLDYAAGRAAAAVDTALADKHGRWVLDNTHEHSEAEFPVTLVKGNEVHHLIIDRTFVDEAGVRWIVDYKTSSHEGGGLEEFISNELERYGGQLNSYREAMRALEPGREIRTALYFPLLGLFREYQPAD